jgi:predicted nuclease of restriction endonuclease-like (RecB) superfamily
MKLTASFFDDIRELIAGARTTVVRGVDLVQVRTNFEIGRRIVKEEQRGKDRAAYGKEVIRALADRLTGEFGKGFSTSNLAYMRTFHLLHRDRQPIFQSVTGKSGSSQIGQSVTDQFNATRKSQTVSDQLAIFQSLTGKLGSPPVRPFTLSWTHYVFLLGLKNPNERSFYEIEAHQQNWTVRELKRQFDSGLYERLALSRNKKGIRRLAQKGQTVGHSRDLLKEPLVLEFLGLDERSRYSESDLESAIINQIERFLLEMGKGILFEARQKRFTFDEEHFFVDRQSKRLDEVCEIIMGQAPMVTPTM